MSRTLTGLSLLLILLLPCTGSTLAQAEAGTWSSADSMHDPRDGHTATLLSNGKLLIAGGCAGENGNSLGLASAELYDPATGTWTLTGSMTTARVEHTATLLASGKVLVVDRTTQASPGVGNRLASLTSVAGFVAIDAPIATEGRLSISALIERKARIA